MVHGAEQPSNSTLAGSPSEGIIEVMHLIMSYALLASIGGLKQNVSNSTRKT